MKKKTKMKTTNIIQRLCLFLFVLVLAAPAWATDYGREGYKIFRSRELGTHQTVTTLRKGPVEVWFSHCKTSGGTGSGAIYELQKGTRIQIEVDEGYAIRWVILRDTEGGKRYSDPEGIKRISSVTPGYQYYFERNAISNSHISGGNQNQLNDDDNNIVVYNYDAPEKIVYMWSHHNKNWDQFKVRDIIVGYVKSPKVRFEKDKYDIYTVSKSFKPGLNNGEDYGNKVKYKLSNNDIADVKVDGSLMLKRPGTVVLTATCNANKNCAHVECSTTINVMRDRVTFSADGLPYVIFNDAPFDLHRNLKRTTLSGKPFLWGRWWENYNFGIRSSNSEILFYKEHIGLDYDAGKIKFGGTAGEATITLKQEENPFYEATTFSHTFIAMRRDQYGTILIKDANEWKLFCKLVNDKGMTGLNARLEADIDLGSDIAMVGTTSHPYAGTFDGQNHALTMNWNAGNTKDIAPFKKVKDATIRNLRTKGTITSSSYYLSGLIDEAYGKTTITGCISEVNITSSYNEGSSDVAGMVAYIYSGSVVTFDDCIVKGTLKATTNEGKKAVSGFVHGQHGTCTLTNCLYIGDNNATGGNTFADNATVTNCYYLKACGNKQGEQVTADQLKNGYVAYKLQAGRQYTTWGQAFGSDEPRLTDNVEYRVYKVDFTYNSQVRATRYATRNKHIYGSMPTFTPKDLLGSGYNEHHYYTLAFAEGFNENTTVTFDKRVAINITEKDAYEIGSVANWKEFCNIVSGGQNAVDAKMIADVNLGGDIVMVGAGEHKYSGTFDGREHTLTLNWNSSSSRQLAPFLYVKGATIKNLRVKGDINSNTYGLSGLIYSAYGATTISGCVSNVNLTSSYGNSAGCDASGMVRIVNSGANVTITDCIVKGKFHATTDNGKKGMGGFVYYQGGTCTLTNCLYIGKNNATSNSDTFAKDATVKNCYYLNACGEAQGTKVTEEQLKNGHVAKLLQGDRTDQCYWAQPLGETPSLYREADKAGANYVYYNKVNNSWACDDFRLTDGQPLPIGLDFIATKASYERDLSTAAKATICLPYELSVQGFKAYTLSGGNNSAVYFAEAKDKLEAYKPYLITADGTLQLGGTNIQVKAYKADALTTPAGKYSFTGTVVGVSNATAAAANAYILQDDGLFHKVTTEHPGATVPAYRAYVTCPKGSGAKQLSIVIDGETTGIGGATNDARGRADGPVYDLQGRRVADRLDDDARHRLPAGVYIVGGRKVVVK